MASIARNRLAVRIAGVVRQIARASTSPGFHI
jgi:hypothetical protein